jgi:hypothetical protein
MNFSPEDTQKTLGAEAGRGLGRERLPKLCNENGLHGDHQNETGQNWRYQKGFRKMQNVQPARPNH